MKAPPYRSRRLLPLGMVPLLVLVSIPVDALGRTGVLSEYDITSWNDSDGLFASWINAIAQDGDGYLWLGTEYGLIRFDGVRFTRFEAGGESQFTQRFVSALHVARDGSVWVGSPGGISRIEGALVKNYGEREGVSLRSLSFAEDNRGTVWAATRDGLYRFEIDRWKKEVAGLPDGPVLNAYHDREGTLWVGTSEGVFRRRSAHDMFQAVDKSLRYFPSFIESSAGSMWITDPVTGFRQLDQSDGRGRLILPGRRGNGNKLLYDRLGNLWVATLGQGLWFVDNNNKRSPGASVEVIGAHNGLSSDVVRSLFEDREGNVWVGTQIGLHKLSRRRVTQITGLGNVRAVEMSREGAMWVGTSDGLAHFSRGGERWYREGDGLPDSDIRALHVDRDGVLWVATASGVARLEAGGFSPLRSLGRDWPTRINAITGDLSGYLWICDQDYGLLRWKNGQLSTFDPSPEADHTIVDAVTTDSSGRIWLSLAGGGIGLFDRDGRFRVLRGKDATKLSELSVYEDKAGTVWLGGGDRLSRFQDGKLAAIALGASQGDAILAIADDEDGELWIGMRSGIVRLSRSEFDRALTDPAHELDFRLYDASEGLAGMPVRVASPNVVRARDGKLWFVTSDGLTIVDPGGLSTNRAVPPVRIERIAADGRWFDRRQGLSLPPRTARLQIDYTSLTFLAPTKVQFRYRLEGFDESWIDAGGRRQAFYTNLAPRQYRFHVIARNSERVWNEQGDVLEFSVLPAVYHTGWFYAACVCAGILILFAGWRMKLGHTRRQFALVLAERVRLSREIHDTLLQSLVGVALHLTGVASSLDASAPREKEQLERIRRQVEEHIREARRSIWDLRSPMLDTTDLASALRRAAEQALQGKAMLLNCVVKGRARRWPVTTEEQLLRIGMEAVSNTVRHARAQTVDVELCYEANSLRLTVSDDGCGFDQIERAHQSGNHCGLLIMQERAEQVGAQFKLVTCKGVGTTVEIVVSELLTH